MSTWGFGQESNQVAAGANTVAAIIKGHQPHYQADNMASKRNVIATSAGCVRRTHGTGGRANRAFDEIIVAANPTGSNPTGDPISNPRWEPPYIDCYKYPMLPMCKDNNNPDPKDPKDPNPDKKACMKVQTSPAGPFEQDDGSLQLPLYGISSTNGTNIDSMEITVLSGASSIQNGPVFAVGTPMPEIYGAYQNSVVLNLCGFDSTKVKPGEPYDCCNVKVKVKIWGDGNQTMEVIK